MSGAAQRFGAVERLHQAYLTGLLLYVLQKEGAEAGAELIFRAFRRQHLAKFLPGLQSLGLLDLPPAVACAQFIYLANRVGGVEVEYCRESDRKAWVHYPPPRWIYEGAALCSVPPEVPVAFLRAFHAHCGVSLGNPRLGFVCTMVTTDGDPGLEGYFYEADQDLAPDQRLRMALDEMGPRYRRAEVPPLPFEGERLAKARRNYAVQYIRVALPELCAMFGGRGASFAREAAVLVGMQLYRETASLLGTEGEGPAGFAAYLAEMLTGCGSQASVAPVAGGYEIRVSKLRVLDEDESPGVLDAWNGLWTGALSVHDRSLELVMVKRPDRHGGGGCWRLLSKPE